MLDWFLAKLEKEWKVIKGAPISFGAACVLSLAIAIMLCMAIFGSDASLLRSTIQDYKEKITSISAASKSGQALIYVNDPNEEKLTPENINQAAIAYANNSSKPMWSWNTATHVWQ